MVRASAKLRQAGIDQPWFEAQLLLASVLNLQALELILHDDEELNPMEHKAFMEFVEQRVKRRPLAYIVGSKHFMDWEFYVDERVLIPRPETELLVELAAEELGRRFPETPLYLADVGTGSGAIGLSLLALLPSARLAAVDISEPALQVARVNARRLKVEGRVCFYQGNFLEPLESWRGRLHCVTANLPYVSEGDYSRLQPEITSFEPYSALVSGCDGLDHYRRLLITVKDYLCPGGMAFVEIGSTQAEQITQLFIAGGYKDPRVVEDLAGHPRIIWSEK